MRNQISVLTFQTWFFGVGTETKEQASARRVLAWVSVVPALIALGIAVWYINDGPEESTDREAGRVLLDSYVGSVWGSSDAFAFALLALLVGLLVESYFRVLAAAISIGAIWYFLYNSVDIVKQFSSDREIDPRRLATSICIGLSFAILAAFDFTRTFKRNRELMQGLGVRSCDGPELEVPSPVVGSGLVVVVLLLVGELIRRARRGQGSPRS